MYHSLKIIVCCIILSVTLSISGNRLNGKWQSLFDGKTLEGWEQKGGNAKYYVEDGIIVGESVLDEPNSFLCTKTNFGNFILELEFLVDETMNSGIQIRSNSISEYKDGRVHGYQVEIDPSKRSWTAGIYDEAGRGWLYDLRLNEPARKAFKHKEWNVLHIEAIGSSFRTWLNGVPAANLIDEMTKEGFIGLQVHSLPEAGVKVRWRNIRIIDLGTSTNYPTLVKIKK